MQVCASQRSLVIFTLYAVTLILCRNRIYRLMRATTLNERVRVQKKSYVPVTKALRTQYSTLRQDLHPVPTGCKSWRNVTSASWHLRVVHLSPAGDLK